jgi:hypothetical protein
MASVISQYFSDEEVDALERGSVDLAKISTSLLVPFAARRLNGVRIAWLNVRWFLQRGIDVLDDMTRHRVESWLIEEFGYAVVGDPSAWPAQAIKHFQADRYGSTEGTTPHGGSGRSGIAGRFCAKGIGVTPLVGRGAAPGHAHGCASLEECIREATYGEVIDAEFPFGAVPIIGVLDTRLEFIDPDARDSGRRRVRRGILIRPCVLRPAHAERAPLFRQPAASDSQNRSSQREDAARTQAVVHHWLGNGVANGAAVSPEDLIARLSRQIAFGQVHRISSGGMFSSNVSITGALLDFGNAHALPDWSHAKLLDHAAGFGEEMITLRAVVKSLAFYLSKYAPPGSRVVSERELQDYATQCHRDEFARECLRVFNLGELSDASAQLAEVLRTHFGQQQQRRVRYRDGCIAESTSVPSARPWLGDALLCASTGDACLTGPGAALMQSIDACLRAAFEGTSDPERLVVGAYITARRYFGLRRNLARDELIDAMTKLVASVSRSDEPAAPVIEAAVDLIIGNSRVHWRMLPTRLAVRAKKAFGSSCALVCVDLIQGGQVVWLEGVNHGCRLHLFDRWLTGRQDELQGLQSSAAQWNALVPVQSLSSWYSSGSEISELVRSAPGHFEWYDHNDLADEASLNTE